MTRTILTGLTVSVLAVALSGAGCQSTGIGDPCTPEKEYDPTFAGFVEQEVSTEGESFQCQTRLCLVNHFQGRATCPYGQDAMGQADSAGHQPCATPGIAQPVTGPLNSAGKPVDAMTGERVAAAVHRAHQGPDRLLLLPLRGHQRNPERRELLHLPDRVLVHPARQLDQRRGRSGPHRRLLHQERHRLRLGLRRDHLHDVRRGATARTAAAPITPGERDAGRARPPRRARGGRLPLRAGVRRPRAQSAARAPRARRGRSKGHADGRDRGPHARRRVVSPRLRERRRG